MSDGTKPLFEAKLINCKLGICKKNVGEIQKDVQIFFQKNAS